MSSKVKQRKKESKLEKTDPSKLTSNETLEHDQKSQGIKIDYKRILIRCIVIILIIIFMNFTQKNNVETFASHKEELDKKDIVITCSDDYLEDLEKFPACAPKKCGRFVSDTVVLLSEVQALLLIAEKGLSLGGSGGGASILDLHSGALSKGDSFVNLYAIDKTHKIITNEDLKMYKHVKDKIKSAIVNHFGVNPSKLYLAHPTFFSRITSDPAKTIHDEYWHPHVDKETYKSFHYTSLLYLTNYNDNFSGGRFIFVDKDTNRTVEPRAGRLSSFTSGSENLHYVEPVKKGTRFAITVSFTCDPKQGIKDPSIPKQ